MNSAIVALFITPKFKETVLQLTKEQLLRAKLVQPNSQNIGEAADMHENPLEELKNLFTQLATTKNDFVVPSIFRGSLHPRFKNSHYEEDASEFFREYLNLIEKPFEKALEKVNNNSNVGLNHNFLLQNFVDECFAGGITNLIICNVCNKVQKQVDKVLDMTVNFNPKGQDPRTKKYDLNALLSLIFEKEVFEGQNKYYCGQCGGLSDLTTKTSQLTKIPECLIITLNRFQFDSLNNQRLKICDPVSIPHELDFEQISLTTSQILAGNSKYYLYALIVHYVMKPIQVWIANFLMQKGSSAEHGHYFTIAREGREHKKWFLFNDNNVTSMDEQDFKELFE